MPLDPVERADGESPRNTPEYIDENPAMDLIQEGLDLSEEERREAADDVYGEDPSLPISDDDESEYAPEIAAIHGADPDDDF